MSEPLTFIDADGHLLEPPTAFVDYAPDEYRETVWQVRAEDDGKEWLTLEDMHMEAAVMALAAAGGFDESTRAFEPTPAISTTPSFPTTAGRPTARLAALDADGIAQSVLYPTMLLTFQHLRSIEFAAMQCRAYNDWVSDLCAKGRGRLHGVAILPHLDPERAAAEIRRVADLPHIVGVQVRPNPAMGWKPLNDEVYDPIWAAASDVGLPVGFHPLSSNDLPGAVQGLRLANLGTSDIPVQDQEDYGADNIFFAQAIGNPVDMMSAVTFMTAGGVLDRFPDASRRVPRGQRWLDRSVARAARPPLRDLLVGRPLAEGAAVGDLPPAVLDQLRSGRDHAGVHGPIAAGRSRPHRVGVRLPPPRRQVSPGTTKMLAEAIAELPVEEQRLIAGGSAAELYGLDLTLT